MAKNNKIIKIIPFAFFLILVTIAVSFFSSDTDFKENKKFFYIKTHSDLNQVINKLVAEGVIKSPIIFQWAAKIAGYENNIRPGKYQIENGSNIFSIIKKLRRGNQTAVNLVINKLRTREDFAKKIGDNFECDSANVMAILNNEDSLRKFELDSNTAMTAIIPNTYQILWNTSASVIFKKLYNEKEIFWNEQRRKKALSLNLNPTEAYILASIVEEETNIESDKGKIASVYLNRLKIGMKLAADPTVKFAMKDFSLKRIYFKHLKFTSPFNTYQQVGLPPGPICTPSTKTIDAVLNAPSTSYLFFVAKPDLNGFSNFSTKYNEHMHFAKQYQQALDSFMNLKSTIK
jgi:UPF0755 protein